MEALTDLSENDREVHLDLMRLSHTKYSGSEKSIVEQLSSQSQ